MRRQNVKLSNPVAVLWIPFPGKLALIGPTFRIPQMPQSPGPTNVEIETSSKEQGPVTRIAVVIVNYRTPGLTVDCLDSLDKVRHEAGELQAFVVDNASGDDSAQAISAAIEENQWGQWAQLISAPKNGGFSYGNNIGIREALASPREYQAVWLLNSDTLVRSGAVAGIAQALRTSSYREGVFGTRLEWPDGMLQTSCFRFIRPSTELVSAASTSIVSQLFRRGVVAVDGEADAERDWVSFASVVLPRQVIERVGLLDEEYFMYFEDVDYCQQVKLASYEVHYLPSARVVHLRGGSSPVKSLAVERKRRPKYYFAARNRYYAKWYGGRLGVFRANACWSIGRMVSLLRESLGKRPVAACQAEWRDIWTNASDPLGGGAL